MGEPRGAIPRDRRLLAAPEQHAVVGVTRQPQSPPPAKCTPRTPRDPPSEPAGRDGPRCRDSFQDCVFVCLLPPHGDAAWGPGVGPGPRGPPPVHTAPREIPGALRHPVGVLAVLLPRVALSHHHPVSPPRELPPQGAAARSIAAPRTLGPAAGQGGGAPLAALCCGNRMWFGM